MRRSRDRLSKGPAVLRFFIYLLIIIILVTLAVIFLGMGKNDGERPYVVTGTCTPGAYVLDITPEPSIEPTVTPPQITIEPTIEPTIEATVEPTIAITPTPVPTNIPESALSVWRTDFKLPEEDGNGEIGISSSYVSAVDNYSIMELTGWGYANVDYFDGTQCGTYLIVIQQTSGRALAYLTENEDGISGRLHVDAVCKNPSASDWRAYIDVSDYNPGMYSLGLVLCYKNGDNDVYSYYEFDDLQSFTVKDGEIITPVTVSGLE